MKQVDGSKASEEDLTLSDKTDAKEDAEIDQVLASQRYLYAWFLYLENPRILLYMYMYMYSCFSM